VKGPLPSSIGGKGPFTPDDHDPGALANSRPPLLSQWHQRLHVVGLVEPPGRQGGRIIRWPALIGVSLDRWIGSATPGGH